MVCYLFWAVLKESGKGELMYLETNPYMCMYQEDPHDVHVDLSVFLTSDQCKPNSLRAGLQESTQHGEHKENMWLRSRSKAAALGQQNQDPSSKQKYGSRLFKPGCLPSVGQKQVNHLCLSPFDRRRT